MSSSHLEGDADHKTIIENLDTLRVNKNEKITLEFINQTPTELVIDQSRESGDISAFRIEQSDFSIFTPEKSGTYILEMQAKYADGSIVHHFLKVNVN